MRNAHTAAKVAWLSSGKGGSKETYIAVQPRHPARGCRFTIEGTAVRAESRLSQRAGNGCIGLNAPVSSLLLKEEITEEHLTTRQADELLRGSTKMVIGLLASASFPARKSASPLAR